MTKTLKWSMAAALLVLLGRVVPAGADDCVWMRNCSGGLINSTTYNGSNVATRQPNWGIGSSCESRAHWQATSPPPRGDYAEVRVLMDDSRVSLLLISAIDDWKSWSASAPDDDTSPIVFFPSFYYVKWVTYGELTGLPGIDLGAIAACARSYYATMCSARPCVIDGANIYMTYECQTSQGLPMFMGDCTVSCDQYSYDTGTVFHHELGHVNGFEDQYSVNCKTVVMAPLPAKTVHGISSPEGNMFRRVMTFGACCPTLVQISGLDAVVDADRVSLSWSAYVSSTARFQVMRGGKANGSFQPVGKEITSTSEQSDYHFVDTSAKPGTDYFYKVGFRESSGPWQYSGVVQTHTRAAVYELHPVLPNPSNGSVTINYEVAAPGIAQLEVYNVQGRLLHRLLNRQVDAGAGTVAWNGLDDTGHHVAAGTYYYRLLLNGRPVGTRSSTILR